MNVNNAEGARKRTRAMKTAVLVMACIIFLPQTQFCHGSMKDFRRLDERKCSLLTPEDMQKLPPEYQKYLGFVKICNLKRMGPDNVWKTALISVWAHDYLNSKGKTSSWEDFPAPLLIDSNFIEIGRLPELYPMDWATHLIVSYGKWLNGRPSEIQVNVSNPAVSGDYHYPPLQWNPVAGRYEMKNDQPSAGKRPPTER